MGQKVHPYGFRVGYIKDWKSRWFAKKKEFATMLLEDIKIKKYVKKSLAQAAVSLIEIERASDRIRIIIHTARPGVIIGRRGQEIEGLKEKLQSMVGIKQLFIDIREVKNPEMDAQLVAENIAFQLEKRIAFRRAMKRAVQMARDAGCEGIKLRCSGRLGGAEIARSEAYKFGKVPLHTLRADIDYGFTEAYTTYGLIGVKVWIYKGERLVKKTGKEEQKDAVNAQKGQIS